MPQPGVTIEQLQDGAVLASRALGLGRWLLGEAPVVVCVTAEACWVEAAPGTLCVNGVATEREALRSGDLVTCADATFRVRRWPTCNHRYSLAVSPLRVGLCIELWWHDHCLERLVSWDDAVQPPSGLRSLDGYEGVELAALRVDSSYRVFVPEGWEASQSLEGRFAVVPLFRAVVIEKRGLQLRASLTTAERPSRWRPRLMGAASLAVLAGLLGLWVVPPRESPPHLPPPVGLDVWKPGHRPVCGLSKQTGWVELPIDDESAAAFAQVDACFVGPRDQPVVSWIKHRTSEASDIAAHDGAHQVTDPKTLACLRRAIARLPVSKLERGIGRSLLGPREYQLPTYTPGSEPFHPGSLMPGDRSVLMSHGDHIANCFRNHPQRAHRTALRWNMRADGQAEQVQPLSKPGTELEKCLASGVTRWRFPSNQPGFRVATFGVGVTPGRTYATYDSSAVHAN